MRESIRVLRCAQRKYVLAGVLVVIGVLAMSIGYMLIGWLIIIISLIPYVSGNMNSNRGHELRIIVEESVPKDQQSNYHEK